MIRYSAPPLRKLSISDCSLALYAGFLLFATVMPGAYSDASAFKSVIEEDWNRQEVRLGRDPASQESLEAALRRAEELFKDLCVVPEVSAMRDRMQVLSSRVKSSDRLGSRQRRALYHDLRWFTRTMALENPLFRDMPLAFMQRRRFICQMLHEYLGYYYDYGDIEGGGIYVLERPGESFEVRELIQGRLPKGNYSTLALSYDAATLFFAFAPRAEGKPYFYSPDRKCFHLYAVQTDGTELRQLTDGLHDDFDPCPLPDGGIAFMSSRRGGFTRCNNPWEPLPAHTLHRREPDGRIRMLSAHETSEWHPKVLNDGRIAYIRWDYVDRSAAHFHGIWVSNPDGSNARQLFGNYTQQVNACYQPHPIPGSQRIAFLAGAHHANVGGSLILLDPSRHTLNSLSGEDDLHALERLTPEVCFPEAPNEWPDSYFHSPWPLSEDYFLVSFSFDPLPGMSAKTQEDTETGLYLFDRFGNMELLYREPGISSMYPLPLRARPCPPVIPTTLNTDLGESGEFLLANVYESHLPFPPDRKITRLHVYQLLPKSETHVANQPRLGYANAESARMLLGSVPVHPDGSARFRAPAGKPLAFQAIDESGRAVQGMRSAVYLQPGERRSCVGCHESPERSGDMIDRRLTALQHEPSELTPGPDGTMPWSFPRLVQPILEKHCARCHDGADADAAAPLLDTQEDGPFTTAYNALKPFVKWYEWGGDSISIITTRPGEMPSDVSPLIPVLHDDNHQSDVQLTDEDWRTLYTWLDGNAAFYGAYSEAERLAQLHGTAIAPPSLQ